MAISILSGISALSAMQAEAQRMKPSGGWTAASLAAMATVLQSHGAVVHAPDHGRSSRHAMMIDAARLIEVALAEHRLVAVN